MPKPRKANNDPIPRKLHIFCEGAKTEPLYIKGYLELKVSKALRSVITIEKTNKNTPVQLVDAAVELQNTNATMPDDVFWVVYDREAVGKYSHSLHSRARKKAEDNGINIALSNVCFEYWLLLHLIDTQASYTSYDNLKKTSPFSAEIKKLTGESYEKSRNIFSVIKDRIPDARSRSAKLNRDIASSADARSDAEHEKNPFMGMVNLLDAIDAFSGT